MKQYIPASIRNWFLQQPVYTRPSVNIVLLLLLIAMFPVGLLIMLALLVIETIINGE